MKTLKYIELFSGIGAFSLATRNIKSTNFKCVFSSDIDKNCAEVYKNNFGCDSLCDITKVNPNDIPEHDFCFFSPPCQAFSKSGKRLGFEEARGTLIYNVFEILKVHHPKYILMENVKNIVNHDNGNTWKTISNALKELGYQIPEKPIILSPHLFKVPQTRDRAFLPGIYNPDHVKEPLKISFDDFYTKDDCEASSIIMEKYNKDPKLKISKTESLVLKCWDDFYKIVKKTHPVIGFPIWYDYFYKKPIEKNMPDWKKDFIEKNQNIYNEYKDQIHEWEKKYGYLEGFIPSHRKFEWQAGKKIKSIKQGIIQFRPSGVRVKAPTTYPALVAIVQIPVYGPLNRRLGPLECAQLQSFDTNYKFHTDYQKTYRQLGNSINVTVLTEVLKQLLHY